MSLTIISYEVACDLNGLTGADLILWNSDTQDKRMDGVPFFCYSHLLARITVGPQTCAPGPDNAACPFFDLTKASNGS